MRAQLLNMDCCINSFKYKVISGSAIKSSSTDWQKLLKNIFVSS